MSISSGFISVWSRGPQILGGVEKDLSLGEMDLTLQISILQSLLSDFQRQTSERSFFFFFIAFEPSDE